jgi:hypothetical protein
MPSLPYSCHVCKWSGTAEVTEPGDGAMCPNCGVLLYPRAWGETWGLTILIIGVTLGLVALVAYLL